MSTLHEIKDQLATLSAAEKAQALRWLVQDMGEAFPGIESTPGVCGGEPRTVRTRLPVWLLVRARQHGASEAALLGSYPMLTAEDLANAWAYHRAHRAEIGEQIAANEAD